MSLSIRRLPLVTTPADPPSVRLPVAGPPQGDRWLVVSNAPEQFRTSPEPEILWGTQIDPGGNVRLYLWHINGSAQRRTISVLHRRGVVTNAVEIYGKAGDLNFAGSAGKASAVAQLRTTTTHRKRDLDELRLDAGRGWYGIYEFTLPADVSELQIVAGRDATLDWAAGPPVPPVNSAGSPQTHVRGAWRGISCLIDLGGQPVTSTAPRAWSIEDNPAAPLYPARPDRQATANKGMYGSDLRFRIQYDNTSGQTGSVQLFLRGRNVGSGNRFFGAVRHGTTHEVPPISNGERHGLFEITGIPPGEAGAFEFVLAVAGGATLPVDLVAAWR